MLYALHTTWLSHAARKFFLTDSGGVTLAVACPDNTNHNDATLRAAAAAAHSQMTRAKKSPEFQGFFPLPASRPSGLEAGSWLGD